jgi:hypothetical protein
LSYILEIKNEHVRVFVMLFFACKITLFNERERESELHFSAAKDVDFGRKTSIYFGH